MYNRPPVSSVESKTNYLQLAQKAYELAKENKEEEVEDILKETDIWEVHAFALRGYAEGNYSVPLNNLLAKCLQSLKHDNANITPDVFLSQIILGYASVDNHPQVAVYLSKAKELKLNLLDCQLKAVEGYAGHDNEEQVNLIFSQAETKKDLITLKNKACVSFKTIGKIEKMHEEESDPECIKMIEGELISRYVKENFYEKLVGLIAQLSNPDHQKNMRKLSLYRIFSTKIRPFVFDTLKYLIASANDNSERDDHWCNTAAHFASAGNLTLTDKSLGEINNEEKLLAVKEAVLGHYLLHCNADGANYFISKNPHLDISKICSRHMILFFDDIFYDEESFYRSTFMKFLRCLDNKTARDFCIDIMLRRERLEIANKDIVKSQQSVEQFNHFMRKHQFTYDYAMAWKETEEVLCWFLQGIQLFQEGSHPYHISPEIFILISSYVLGCKQKETIEHFTNHCATVPDTLYAVSTQTLCAKRFGTQFHLFTHPLRSNQTSMTQEEFEKGMQEAKDKYLYRSCRNN